MKNYLDTKFNMESQSESWYSRMKTDNPEMYASRLERSKMWWRRSYQDIEFRLKVVEARRAYRAEKSKDPEWMERRRQYERERRSRNRKKV